jgi:hypothetical protein
MSAEPLLWNGYLGHLEDDIAAVAHELRADLDELTSTYMSFARAR